MERSDSDPHDIIDLAQLPPRDQVVYRVVQDIIADLHSRGDAKPSDPNYQTDEAIGNQHLGHFDLGNNSRWFVGAVRKMLGYR